MVTGKTGRFLAICLWPVGFLPGLQAAESLAEYGPAYHQFRLTLDAGYRTEAAGPLYYHDVKEDTHVWASPPLFSYTLNSSIEYEEFDFLYPLLSYDRFGSEYRFHIFQVFAFAGGQTQTEENVRRFTLFPIYFQQRSPVPDLNYTAVLPFYGTLKNRLFRDEVHFVMMPFYVQSRKKDVVTDNYVYPIVHVRHGDGLKGWQVWPIVGKEHKDPTTFTNHWGDPVPVPGHDRFFGPWPIYLTATSGIGTTNVVTQEAVLPFWSSFKSPLRDTWTSPWPFGLTHTIEREKKYSEWGAPWPIVVFTRGEGKYTSRIWPFYSQAHTPTVESDFYMWPVYKYNRYKTESLERDRSRILFFLYSNTREKNLETGSTTSRRDFWPFYTWRRDWDGSERLQALSILEPLIPNNKSIERDYSHIWALWRAEKNARTGASSQSLLWNLYRRDSSREEKKVSLLFGLFKYQSNSDGRRWSLFHVPIAKKSASAQSSSAH
jgi:hypothetical protein